MNSDAFADVINGNEAYSLEYVDRGLVGRAAKGLAVLTCMDSRIEPLRMLGLAPGDAKIMRNAGARVTEDQLRTMVLAHYLLGVERIMVVAHTNCRMNTADESDVHEAIRSAGGPDTRSIAFLTSADQRDCLQSDVQRIRSYPYLPGVISGGFLLDIHSGLLEQVC